MSVWNRPFRWHCLRCHVPMPSMMLECRCSMPVPNNAPKEEARPSPASPE